MPWPFEFPHALLFWPVCLWAYFSELRIITVSWHRATEAGSRDAGSHRVILYGTALAFAVAFPLAWVEPLRVPDEVNPLTFAAGLAFLVGGGLLRRHCRRMLGVNFTGDVSAQPTQTVVDRGAYAWVRHPSYSGAILRNLGIGLALGNWASAGLLAAVSFAIYRYRIAVEERVLLETIGDPYRRYMEKHKRLIPFVY